MIAGIAPTCLGLVDVTCEEMMFYQYLPVAMPYTEHRVPDNLHWTIPLLNEVDIYRDCYIYLTAKQLYVEAGTYPNRPGWHSDGFGTDDINYIWSDSCPTEFCIQEFNLSDDHEKSLIEMEQQARQENIVTYKNKYLLKLDQHVIHRVAKAEKSGYRTFVKISVSKHQYNLKGNAHNYLFDYKWDMQDRKETRNHPIA